MILPALALQEGFCQHQMACAIMRRKYWPLLTDILQALTSRIHAVTAKDRPLANSPNVPSCLSVPLPWRQLKCSKVFMCRTNSAKEAIVLAHSTQSYRPCTLTPAHSFSNPLLFESGVKTAWNSGGNHRGTEAAVERWAARKARPAGAVWSTGNYCAWSFSGFFLFYVTTNVKPKQRIS